MRIISGKYKGLKLKGFDIDGTRPTMDRVKESLFGIIQNKIDDSICLDLFAGSGNLGIEAISNGAKKVYLVDNNKISIKTINENIKTINEDIKVIETDYKKYLKNTDKTFDIIFLDPPYKENLITKALKIIEQRNLLNTNGIVVCEYETENIITNYKIKKEKSYGSKKIKILEK